MGPEEGGYGTDEYEESVSTGAGSAHGELLLKEQDFERDGSMDGQLSEPGSSVYDMSEEDVDRLPPGIQLKYKQKEIQQLRRLMEAQRHMIRDQKAQIQMREQEFMEYQRTERERVNSLTKHVQEARQERQELVHQSNRQLREFVEERTALIGALAELAQQLKTTCTIQNRQKESTQRAVTSTNPAYQTPLSRTVTFDPRTLASPYSSFSARSTPGSPVASTSTSGQYFAGSGSTSGQYIAGSGSTSGQYIAGSGSISGQYIAGSGSTSGQYIAGSGSTSGQHISPSLGSALESLARLCSVGVRGKGSSTVDAMVDQVQDVYKVVMQLHQQVLENEQHLTQVTQEKSWLQEQFMAMDMSLQDLARSVMRFEAQYGTSATGSARGFAAAPGESMLSRLNRMGNVMKALLNNMTAKEEELRALRSEIVSRDEMDRQQAPWRKLATKLMEAGRKVDGW